MKSKSPILDGAMERMENQEYARAMAQSARMPRVTDDDPNVTVFDLARGDKITASKAVVNVQPLKPELEDAPGLFLPVSVERSDVAGKTFLYDDAGKWIADLNSRHADEICRSLNAAPGLLEALTELLGCVVPTGMDTRTDRAMIDAQKAIARAKGGAL